MISERKNWVHMKRGVHTGGDGTYGQGGLHVWG